MKLDFAIPEPNVGLSDFERRLFEVILEHWPVSALELAAHFKESLISTDDKKRVSTKYCYYLKKLVAKRLVLAKRAGNSFIVWPLVVEKYRTIHHILKE